MSITRQDRDDSSTTEATFGSGGAEPYARALRRGSDVLFLHETHLGELSGSASMDVAKWNADADATDFSLLRSVTGPVLDIGCGPGRMVRAAMDLGIEALGIDVSQAAVDIAGSAGLRVIRRSIFERIPSEGSWQTALLVDGNIGIGGDVDAMIARCGEILAADGDIVVELNPDAAWERHYTGKLVDTHGHQSASFPWAEIGLDRLVSRAEPLGFAPRQSWVLDDRSFCRLAKTRR